MSRSIVIGSSSAADLRVQTEQVAPVHCRFGEDEFGFYLIDLGSEQGTRVNGAELAPGTKHRLEGAPAILLGEDHLMDMGELKKALAEKEDDQLPQKVQAVPVVMVDKAPQKEARGDGPGKNCPKCGSNQVINRDLYDRKYKKETKIKISGCGCFGTAALLLFMIVFLPITLGLGSLAALGAVGSVIYFLAENWKLTLVGIFILAGIGGLRDARRPKLICERCGHKFNDK